MQLLAFENYRDLVKLLQQNLTEEQGLVAAELRNIEERASARSAAAAAVGIQAGQTAGPMPSAAPAGECSCGSCCYMHAHVYVYTYHCNMQDKGSSVPLASHTATPPKAAIQEQTALWKIWAKKDLLTVNLVSAVSGFMHLDRAC